MEHLGAEVGELGGLREADLGHGPRAGDGARVHGEHAVHVGPDLDLLRVEQRAEERGGPVGAAAAEGGGDSLLGGADEAGQQGNPPLADQGQDASAQAGLGVGQSRLGAAEGVVRHQDLTRIDGLRGQAAGREGGGGDLEREALAHGRDGVERARRELLEEVDALVEDAQLGEDGLDVTAESVFLGAVGQEAADGFVVPSPQLVHDRRALGIPLQGEAGSSDQLVGDAPEGRHDDERRPRPVIGDEPATPSMRSAEPTLVPPNFMTITTAGGRAPRAARR